MATIKEILNDSKGDLAGAKDLNQNVVPEEAKPITYPPGTVIYQGEYRLLDKRAVPIPKILAVYNPQNDDQVAELEYQVSQGRVTKTVY